jgi:hypothetical protein
MSYSRLLCEFSAHTMGSNAIDMQVIGSCSDSGSDAVVEWRLVLCSGGDDQSLCCTTWALSVLRSKASILRLCRSVEF